MTTKPHQAFRPALLLAVVFIAGIYSCNNNASTEEKKADSATDTMMKPADTTKMIMPADTTKPSDTGREIKVPQPSN
ncbi:hypothetical protein [Pinibacter soli]|uniref:Uncharacterized protein n=1 Tax=Pinibacter soli TaxID=3044211 RepID=A0ABT6RD57_9BACT|nr:hypothetical protein [Pinibacter soli]MDI3320331.1 hypothetical protein [Pinibacter soli]